MNEILTRDLLMNMLLGLVAVVIMLVVMVNPKAKKQEDTPPPGNMSISIKWEDGPYDVDLWVLAPGDGPVGFKAKGGKIFNLLRDDLGFTNDVMPFNAEDAFSRGLPDGEYIINVHYYKGDKVPLPVSVEVRINSNLQVEKRVTLTNSDQEITAIRFKLKNGIIVPNSVAHIFKSIIRSE